MKLVFTFFSFCFLYLQFSILASAEILETKTMKDALSNIEDGSMVVFDLDNTIMAPAQTLGSDQWYEFILQNELDKGHPNEVAITHAIKAWIEVQLMTQVTPIESSTPELIRNLQKRGIKILGLTARPVALAFSTERQLSSIGVRLGGSWAGKFQEGDDVKLHEGVIFVGPKRVKGEVFARYLASNPNSPRRIVFVDDKLRHNQSMESNLAPLGITFTGHRYSAADADVARFSKEIATTQWKYFAAKKVLVSDTDTEKK